MRILVIIFGIVLILLVAQDAFETIVLPRRVTRRIRLQEGAASEQKLAELRATYEPFVNALADRVQVSLPPWIPPADTVDDWRTSAWDDLFPSIRQTLNQVMHPQ